MPTSIAAELTRVGPFLTFNMRNASHGVIVTTAIGPKYLDRWKSFSWKTWSVYAVKHDLGIAVAVEDLVDEETATIKNGSWQKMLLPARLLEEFPTVERFVLIDTDVIISPIAPNIFEHVPPGQFGVVSQELNLPFDVSEVRKRVSFFRHHYYSERFPLDGLILADARSEFRLAGLPEKDNYFCAGVIVCDAAHASQLEEWFTGVSAEETKEATAWEQTHLNHFIQASPHHWLPYRFQALWHYEMAWSYPHLYLLGDKILASKEALFALRSNLWTNYFVHFAGSWHESLAWELGKSLPIPSDSYLMENFRVYLEEDIEPRSYGKIAP